MTKNKDTKAIDIMKEMLSVRPHWLPFTTTTTMAS